MSQQGQLELAASFLIWSRLHQRELPDTRLERMEEDAKRDWAGQEDAR